MNRHAPATQRAIQSSSIAPLLKRRRLEPSWRRVGACAAQQQTTPPPPPPLPPGVSVAPLTPADAANAIRLHRAARLAGVPVFGDGAGVAEAIQAASVGEHGAFGFMAVDEQEVAEGDDGVVGAVVAQQEEEDAAVVLLTIAVRADRRRQGVGRALVRALAARAEAAGNGDRPARVVADVARDNAPARALLEASGFDFGGGGGKKKDKSIEGVLEL